jgi:hypothetical protein
LTNILQWILTKLGTYLDLKRIWNPIDFQGQRSRSQGLIFRRGDTPRFALPLLSLSWMGSYMEIFEARVLEGNLNKWIKVNQFHWYMINWYLLVSKIKSTLDVGKLVTIEIVLKKTKKSMLAYIFSMIKTLKWPYFSGCSIPWHTSRYCIDMTVRQSLLNFITSTRKILELFKYETNLLPKD